MKKKKVEPYPFTPEFERQLVTLASSRPQFLGRFIASLDVDALPSEASQVAFAAIKAIHEDLGKGPSNGLLVIQRLRRWMDDGKVKSSLVEEVNAMMDLAEDAGLVDEEAMLTELVPVLRDRERDATVRAAMDEYSKRGDMSNVISIIERSRRLGTVDVSLGSTVGADSFAAMKEAKSLQKLSTGVPELDFFLQGGLPRGQMGVFIGGAGDGKSMALGHIASHAWKSQMFVAYASLELPEHVVSQRLMANVTGIPIREIVRREKEVITKLEEFDLGDIYFKSFTPHATTPQDIFEWVRVLEEKHEQPIAVLVVDYADKLTAKLKAKKKEENTYNTMELVYEALRLHAEKNKCWVWTASQSVRRNPKEKGLADLSHVADSMGKVRVADLVITLNVKDDGSDIEFFVAKNRTGNSRGKVGPLPVDFECGRLCMSSPASPLDNTGIGW